MTSIEGFGITLSTSTCLEKLLAVIHQLSYEHLEVLYPKSGQGFLSYLLVD
jgi:hypothetical protein